MDSFQMAFNKFGELVIGKFSELSSNIKFVRTWLDILNDHDRRIRVLESK